MLTRRPLQRGTHLLLRRCPAFKSPRASCMDVMYNSGNHADTQHRCWYSKSLVLLDDKPTNNIANPSYPSYADPTTTDQASSTLIPGMSSASPYGSLGDPSDHTAAASTTAWQASHNAQVQRVTQNAMIYELQQSQTQTIERLVPWFLENMPATYFQQVPESFRYDHIKAIAAVQDANMVRMGVVKGHIVMYLNAQHSTSI